MNLKPGMVLLLETWTRAKGEKEDNDEEFLVCRTGEKELNLFSIDDFNRWSDEGFEEGTTLEELAEEELDKDRDKLTLTNKYPFFMEV